MPDLIRRHVTEDQICVLTFDRPDSAANIFDKATLAELNDHINHILCNSDLKGVVIASAKKSIFIAGADLTQLAKARTPAELRDMIELGQLVFNHLTQLSIPVVAAIHGACVGGGYELCLACDYRIASPDKATKIGLPETQLGILPAWGGSTRLPRLIGLPKALDVILGGKTLAAKPALKCGMIDDIAPREYLVEKACKLILTKGKKLRRRRSLPLKLKLANTKRVARFIAGKVEKQVLQKTRGHYPAIPKALEVVVQGLGKSLEESLALERDAILELGANEACRNLIRIFFLQERAKKLTGVPADPAPATKVAPVKRVAVVGAGVMGAGIAQWASSRDISVILRDINHEAVAKGLTSIAKLYEQGVARHALTKVEARAGMDRVSPAAKDVPLASTDIIIEAAVERMELKKELFARLEQLAGAETILATNTSALSITEIASATQYPQRVVGIHFFNPVHRMQLVEVVVGQQTLPEVVRRAVKFVQQIGKLPVVVKDAPGFLVNRILMPYLVEAGYLFEHGARVEDIDETMLEFGMPMGPLRLIDEVSVVDMAGSTIVGGLVQENYWSSTIVVKFDSSGNKLWEFRAGSGNFGGVEALAVDKLGNVFLSSRTPSEALPARVLVKLDPDGRELWHIVQKHASGNPTYASTSSVAVDDSGNVFHLGLVRRSTSDVEFCWTVAVAKYSTAGRRRWLTTLPDCDYGLPLGGIAQAMAVLPDGSLAMVGWRNGGFAAKLDASGRLLWLTSDHRSHFQPGPFSSVLVNNRGAICAGGVDGFTIFSEKGKPLHSDDSLDGVPVALTANGGYLFDQRIGPYVSAVDDKGRTQWRTHTGSLYRFGVVSDGAKGWITTGTAGWDYQLTFFHLDKHGTESWRKSFQGYAYLGRSNAWAEDRTLNSFLCAPDGTLRIVLNLAGSHGVEPGVAVAAFALEEQPQ